MESTNILKAAAGPVIVLLLIGGGWLTRETWKAWLIPPAQRQAEEKKDAPDGPERVKLTPQAKANLRLDVKRLTRTTYERKLHLPGTVVDKPGHSDRGISAPLGGVVTSVSAIPGKTVRAGDELFRLRLVSETFQASQMELYKSTRELDIAEKEYKRLEKISGVAVPATRFLELQYQQDRLNAVIQAHKQDLLTRQLTPAQIERIEKGKFVTEITINMPDRLGKHHDHEGDPLPVPASSDAPDALPVPKRSPTQYEVQELKVNLGDHVQAGQIMAYVADHRFLYIEGRALKQEAKLLARAAKEGWSVEAEFTEDDEDTPGDRLTNLTVEFLGNTMDATGLTLPIYVPFTNPHRSYERNGQIYRSGVYRPGQKVLLKVSIARLEGVFKLPQAAVVREGAEAYVFRQNGDVFDRRPVHVILEDADDVVIEDDGSISEGNYIARNGAGALNRILKTSQADGGGGHGHHHD